MHRRLGHLTLQGVKAVHRRLGHLTLQGVKAVHRRLGHLMEVRKCHVKKSRILSDKSREDIFFSSCMEHFTNLQAILVQGPG